MIGIFIGAGMIAFLALFLTENLWDMSVFHYMHYIEDEDPRISFETFLSSYRETPGNWDLDLKRYRYIFPRYLTDIGWVRVALGDVFDYMRYRRFRAGERRRAERDSVEKAKKRGYEATSSLLAKIGEDIAEQRRRSFTKWVLENEADAREILKKCYGEDFDQPIRRPNPEFVPPPTVKKKERADAERS